MINCLAEKEIDMQSPKHRNMELKIRMGLKIGCRVKFSYDGGLVLLSKDNDITYMDDYIMIRDNEGYLQPYFYEKLSNLKVY